MSIAQLVAVERNENPKKIRESGYLPAVIYGKEVKKNLLVKVKNSDVSSIVNRHGGSAKLQVTVNNKKHLAFIKEVQRNHISGKIIHLDIQFISGKDEIKVKVPIIYEGISELEHKRLILEVNRQDVEVLGNAENIPEQIKLDVSGMNAGMHITGNDLKLDKNVKVHNIDECLASVYKMKEVIEPEEENKDSADA